MILTGNSLGKRQQDLNVRVIAAAEKNIPLEEFQAEEETDVGKLFKLGLASKYKNVDYVIEMLKSEDDLCISKAMKCLWLYDDKYQDYINPDYIDSNIFPFMSNKMRKKFLTTISINVRNEVRSLGFYEYCMKKHFDRYAFKFLISTSNEFKIEMIKNQFQTLKSLQENKQDAVCFIGNNFDLAELYQDQMVEYNPYVTNNWNFFSYLFPVDAVRYLEKWEKYFDVKKDTNIPTLGLRYSKEIMLKHKNRILNFVPLYYKLVNPSIFRKYITKEEAKLYAVASLPKTAKEFWDSRYSYSYRHILDSIPRDERFEFVKNIFTEKYPGNEFEMTREFYNQKYYEIMTDGERESWALCHLSNPNKSFLSDDEDSEYLWCKFVSFDKAIPEIRKYVLTTSSASKRAEIVNVLIKSERNQDDLKKIFQYYYERHVNEDRDTKVTFLSEVVDRFPIWEFNQSCWESFDKLLYSVEVYNPLDSYFNSYSSFSFLVASLFYHVLNKKEFPEGLKIFAESDELINFTNMRYYLKKLNKQEHKDQIFQYLKQYCLEKFLIEKDSEEKDKHINKYTNLLRSLLEHFKKTDEEIPEIMLKYVKSHSVDELSQSKLTKILKQDAPSILSKIPLLRGNFRNDLKINTLLKKIKVYFSNDLAQDFLNYFYQSIILDENSDSNLYAAVHGIFILADASFKSDFMIKYVPNEPKIEYNKIERRNLYIQEAICRFACYSRPPVPLDTIRMYIKGDYVHYCLPMFYMYAANLPPRSCIEFVKALIDAPVSVQKHGLRLAFRCFNNDNLKELILRIWKQSKNISLRMIIYTSLFDYVLKKEDKKELFKILLTLTSDLNEKDHDDVLGILTSGRRHQNNLPDNLKSEFFHSAWVTVSKFRDGKKYVALKVRVIEEIKDCIHLMDFNVVNQIVDDYLNDIFVKKHIFPDKERAKLESLYEARFRLTTTFIAQLGDEDNIKIGLKLAQYVLKKCYEFWNYSNTETGEYSTSKTDPAKYPTRSYCNKFILSLELDYFFPQKKSNTRINMLFEYIVKNLRDSLPIHEVYLLIWRIKTLIITNIVIDSQNTIEISDKDRSKKVINMFSSEIIKITKEFIDQGQFHLTLLYEISNIVVSFVKILNYSLKDSTLEIDDVRTLVGMELVNNNSIESLLMCICIIPNKPSCNTIKEYELLTEKVKMAESFEVQALFYQKIVRAHL